MVVLSNILYNIITAVIGVSYVFIPFFVIPRMVEKYRIYKRIKEHFVKRENLNREDFKHIELSVCKGVDDKIVKYGVLTMIILTVIEVILSWWIKGLQ
jgi:hypothetical protein